MQTTQSQEASTLVRRESATPRRVEAQDINVGSNERLISALAGGLALAWGLSSGSWGGKAAALLGGGLVYRGVRGHCPVYQALETDSVRGDRGATQPKALTSGRERAERSFNLLRTVTVQKTAAEVYRAWSTPETLVQVMGHLASLTPVADGRLRWSVHDPLGHTHSWETEVTEEEPNTRLRWATVEHAPLLKNLTLLLSPAPGGRGTEMKLHLRMKRPAGVLGDVLAKLLGKAPAWVVERALSNMKSLLEAGELPTLKNNPAARASAQP